MTRLLTDFAKHPVAANLLMILLFLLGLWGFLQSSYKYLPATKIPAILLTVAWPGGSSSDIEQSLIEPMEKELRDLRRVKFIDSIARQGSARIYIEFDDGVDPDAAFNEVSEAISQASNLPKNVEEVVVSKVILYETIAKLIITSTDGIEALRPLVRRFERQLLDKGIDKIDIIGLPDEEIAIKIPTRIIHQYRQSLPAIAERIRQQSQDMPLGKIGALDGSKQIRSVAQKRSLEAYAQTRILTQQNGQHVRLADIAEIKNRLKDNTAYVTFHNKAAVVLELQRTSEGDALENARIMQQWLAATKPQLPQSVSLHVYDERWLSIKARLNTLTNNGLQGLMLVLVLLLLFLNPRVALWVAIGIPTAFLGAFALLPVLGLSIDMVTMFSFIMVLGIVVDDAIVIGEECLTQLHVHQTADAAVYKALDNMFFPILSSSLTTMSAFMPLLLVGGTMGQILFSIPAIVIIVILTSLIECFFILPGHLYHAFSAHPLNETPKIRQWLDDKFILFRDQYFSYLLKQALDMRVLVVCAAFVFLLVALSLVISNRLVFTFFPSPESNTIAAQIRFHPSTRPDVIDKALQQIEQALWSANAAYPQSVVQLALIKHRRSVQQGTVTRTDIGDNYATIEVQLVDSDKRRIRNEQIITDWKAGIPVSANIDSLEIQGFRSGPPGRDIEIILTGEEIGELKQASLALQHALRRFDGVYNIQDDVPFGEQEVILHLTPVAKQIGITLDDITSQLRAAFAGEIVQVFFDGANETEVRILLPDDERQRLATLAHFPIVTHQSTVIPLSNLVDQSSQPGYQSLGRRDFKLKVLVTADVNTDVGNANLILESLERTFIDQLKTDYSVDVTFAGRSSEQAETISDMKKGMIVSCSLIYIVLAWVFASYLWPFVVLAIIPFSLAGAILGHFLIGIDLTLLSLFGFFGLAGIVINDSIILVNTYRMIRIAEPELCIKAAVVRATLLRFRAVIITSLTTIAGLTPLLFETSAQAEFLIPMATSITFGLGFSTFLVLFLVPVLLIALKR